MKRKKRMVCIISAVLPFVLVPSTYGLLHLLAHSFTTKSPSPILLLFATLWTSLGIFYCKYKKKYLASDISTPSLVVAHFVTVVTTWLFKLFPVVDAGSSITFFFLCSLLAFLYWRVTVSDPGRITGFHTKPQYKMGRNGKQESENSDREAFWNASKVFSGLEGAETLESQSTGSFGQMHALRGRFCHQCGFFVERFDHHCLAVRNCIGCKNHILFILMLLAFILTEIMYVWCCISYLRRKKHMHTKQDGVWLMLWKYFCEETWVFSTSSFAGLQPLWQVPFLFFHLYCISVNVTTDELVSKLAEIKSVAIIPHG